ncbi:MAG: hypothetical protein EOO77_05225 [Oxalobacteraceae bacterium]|nr:MAG: hypothetical protein EOO77_05225 [Oxalobacteraceae bacterium]
MTAMHDKAMFRKLGEHHANIRAGIAEIRHHCEAVTPDVAGLGAARLRLSKASAARSKFVADEVVPKVRQVADERLRGELTEMQRAFAAKRLKSSEHVTVWSSAAIEKDWQGYRAAARQIWAMMEEQMARESRVLGQRLKPPNQ